MSIESKEHPKQGAPLQVGCIQPLGDAFYRNYEACTKISGRSFSLFVFLTLFGIAILIDALGKYYKYTITFPLINKDVALNSFQIAFPILVLAVFVYAMTYIDRTFEILNRYFRHHRPLVNEQFKVSEELYPWYPLLIMQKRDFLSLLQRVAVSILSWTLFPIASLLNILAAYNVCANPIGETSGTDYQIVITILTIEHFVVVLIVACSWWRFRIQRMNLTLSLLAEEMMRAFFEGFFSKRVDKPAIDFQREAENPIDKMSIGARIYMVLGAKNTKYLRSIFIVFWLLVCVVSPILMYVWNSDVKHWFSFYRG